MRTAFGHDETEAVACCYVAVMAIDRPDQFVERVLAVVRQVTVAQFLRCKDYFAVISVRFDIAAFRRLSQPRARRRLFVLPVGERPGHQDGLSCMRCGRPVLG